MDVKPVDPRDVEGEDRDPVYRVYFWESTAPPGAADPERYAMAAAEHRLTGAEDVQEVLAWAGQHVRPNQAYELWDRDVRVNLTGAFNCTKEVWPYLVENRWGRLIFMSSVAGTLGGFGQASYSSTKAGLIGLAKTAALEGGRHNITANAIAPGIIMSEAGAAAESTNPMYSRFKARTVFKRFGQPEDISNTIAFLCSGEAGYITGAVIEVAGGIPLFTA